MWAKATSGSSGGAMSKTEFLIEMDRLHNLREVAGYATRSGVMREGRLFRSGAWELMSESDHAWFEDRIATVIDLRHPDEVERAAHARTGEPAARVLFTSIFPVDQTMDSMSPATSTFMTRSSRTVVT